MPKTPARQTAEPDDIDVALMDTADALLSEYFFDPDNEDAYKVRLSESRARNETGIVLQEDEFEIFGTPCTMRLEALRTWTMFRVSFSHANFGAAVEGSWSFDNEELQKPAVKDRRGDPDMWDDALDEIDDHFFEDIADEEIDALMAEAGLADEEDDEAPVIDGDAEEPPIASSLDRSRVKTIAKRVSRQKDLQIAAEDRLWLEEMPQTLPVITQELITLAIKKPADPLVAAYLEILGLQLEMVRYRQDRGWDWADAMLRDVQQRMLTFARQGGDGTVLMAIGRHLMQARVPVSDEMRSSLAAAGLGEADVPEPEEAFSQIGSLLSEMASALDSPFDVVGTLKESGAVMPPEMRRFIVDLLARSEHAVMREASALMMLDDDPSVRQAAAAALTETVNVAAPSPATLRRVVAMRDWLPEAEREGVDVAIRSVRQAGVEIGSWPGMPPDTEFHVSMIDGSGAQSVLIPSRGERKGCFRALLLRHGEGVADAWEDPGLSRGRINKLLRDAQGGVVMLKMPADFVATLVQHAVGCGVERGSVPPVGFLQVAEGAAGAGWNAGKLDVVAETDRLFNELPEEERSEAGILEGLGQAAAWMASTETLATWYEDGPHVQAVLGGLPRDDHEARGLAVLSEILPSRRGRWAERFLLMGLWCNASAEAKYRKQKRGMITTAHALLHGTPVEEIDAMVTICGMTVAAAADSRW